MINLHIFVQRGGKAKTGSKSPTQEAHAPEHATHAHRPASSLSPASAHASPAHSPASSPSNSAPASPLLSPNLGPPRGRKNNRGRGANNNNNNNNNGNKGKGQHHNINANATHSFSPPSPNVLRAAHPTLSREVRVAQTSPTIRASPPALRRDLASPTTVCCLIIWWFIVMPY